MSNARIITRPAPVGALGFDTPNAITGAQAYQMREKGYAYAVRYIGRETPHSYDLSAREAFAILTAGLALTIVQHVEADRAPWWKPSADKGARYGDGAARQAHAVGYPNGATIWLDLEAVDPLTPAAVVIEYVNRWSEKVGTAGYLPGAYIGDGARLSAAQLGDLLVNRYWGAYNNDRRETWPAVRGFCMRQRLATAIPGVGFPRNDDVVQMDKLGDVPTFAYFDTTGAA